MMNAHFSLPRRRLAKGCQLCSRLKVPARVEWPIMDKRGQKEGKGERTGIEELVMEHVVKDRDSQLAGGVDVLHQVVQASHHRTHHRVKRGQVAQLRAEDVQAGVHHIQGRPDATIIITTIIIVRKKASSYRISCEMYLTKACLSS
jgi:hypothetical protein